MTAITAAQILRLAPSARADLVAAIVDNWPSAVTAGLTTPRRVRHFFARVLVETGGLKAIEENLNYSVDGLLKTFGRHRITAAQCRGLGRSGGRPADKEGIANIIYGGAWGARNLGNTEPGDGWRYRGGGMLQTTGRAGYRALGLEVNPEALREPGPAFLSAVKEWAKRGCNALADRDDVAAICKAINGGDNGLAEQRAWLAKAAAIWPDAPASAETGYPVLRRGSKGTDVIELQRQLKAAGIDPGGIDGDYGDKTFKAVRELQRRRGLERTGIADRGTRDALADLL